MYFLWQYLHSNEKLGVPLAEGRIGRLHSDKHTFVLLKNWISHQNYLTGNKPKTMNLQILRAWLCNYYMLSSRDCKEILTTIWEFKYRKKCKHDDLFGNCFVRSSIQSSQYSLLPMSVPKITICTSFQIWELHLSLHSIGLVICYLCTDGYFLFCALILLTFKVKRWSIYNPRGHCIQCRHLRFTSVWNIYNPSGHCIHCGPPGFDYVSMHLSTYALGFHKCGCIYPNNNYITWQMWNVSINLVEF